MEEDCEAHDCGLLTMFENSAWSACSHSSNKGAWEMGRRPSLTALVMMDCNRCLSEASMNPHQTGEAYSNLFISVLKVKVMNRFFSIIVKAPPPHQTASFEILRLKIGSAI